MLDYLWVFLIGGLVCMIGEILIITTNKTKGNKQKSKILIHISGFKLFWFFYLVVSDKIIKTIFLAGIIHYPSDNRFTAYGIVVWNICVHATVDLGAIHTPCMSQASFVNVHQMTVFLVEYQVRPRDIVHLA